MEEVQATPGDSRELSREVNQPGMYWIAVWVRNKFVIVSDWNLGVVCYTAVPYINTENFNDFTQFYTKSF